MARKADAQQILECAAAKLQALLHAPVRLVGQRGGGVAGGEKARIVFARGTQETALVPEVKPYLTREGLGLVAEAVARRGPHGVLVTRYVNPVLAHKLRDADTQFVDCAGNAFLRQGSMLLFAVGLRPEQRAAQTRPRDLRPAGIRIVFALLCNPELVKAPYRTIAAQAPVALGAVGPILDDLAELGFVENRPAGRRLVRKPELLDRWVAAYAERLRPRLLLNRFRAADPAWWRTQHVPDTLWGGEVAAYTKTRYLQPQLCTIYADRLPPDTIVANRLTHDPDGAVELVRRFWAFDYTDPDGPLVHPVLVYADLVAEPDKRRREAAGVLRERYLDRYLRQD